LQVKVHEAHRELVAVNELVTVENLKDKPAGKNRQWARMISEIFMEHNKQMIKLIEREHREH
jgi:hypothetical protein